MIYIARKAVVLGMALTAWTGLFALGDIRTCQFETAIPQTSINYYVCSSFRPNLVNRIEGIRPKKSNGVLLGSRLSLRMNPKWELFLWINYNSKNTGLDIGTKHLLYTKDNNYYSFAPTIYHCEGKDRNYNYRSRTTEACNVNGILLPLIWTSDTRRNLFLTASVGVNCDLVSTSSSITTYDQSAYEYVTTKTEYGPYFTSRIYANFGFSARCNNLEIEPEMGLSWILDETEGTKEMFIVGIKMGLIPKELND